MMDQDRPEKCWTLAETARYLRIGKGRARSVAERAGALWMVGDSPRVRIDRLREALDAERLPVPGVNR